MTPDSIDWPAIYKAYKASGLTKPDFYDNEIPHLVHRGLLPSRNLFYRRLREIERSPKQIRSILRTTEQTVHLTALTKADLDHACGKETQQPEQIQATPQSVKLTLPGGAVLEFSTPYPELLALKLAMGAMS